MALTLSSHFGVLFFNHLSGHPLTQRARRIFGALSGGQTCPQGEPLGGTSGEIWYDNLATAVAEHDGGLVRFQRVLSVELRGR